MYLEKSLRYMHPVFIEVLGTDEEDVLYVYIYICVCVCMYIFIYTHTAEYYSAIHLLMAT